MVTPATKTKRAVIDKKVKYELKFELSDTEIVKYARRSAKLTKELAELDKTFKEKKKEHDGKIAEREAEMAQLMAAIGKGEEVRLVDCTEQKDFNKETVTYIFEGKKMLERDMADHEKQMEMALDKHHAGAKAALTPPKTPTERQKQIAEVIKEEKSKNKRDHTAGPSL